MREIKPEEALKRKYPESIVLVSCCGEEGRPNLIPLGWSMQTSFSPPMIAISVGKTRYSHKLIRKTKEFVLTFPGIDMEEEILFCGTHSGREIDKIKELKLKTLPAETVKPPLIEKAMVNMECRVTGSLDTGDHTIFAGQIIKAHVSDKEIKKLYTVGHFKFGGF
jgi:flavin reductase (DIM6/NTAB) family NADH-FMN oxidoreductase RutF